MHLKGSYVTVISPPNYFQYIHMQLDSACISIINTFLYPHNSIYANNKINNTTTTKKIKSMFKCLNSVFCASRRTRVQLSIHHTNVGVELSLGTQRPNLWNKLTKESRCVFKRCLIERNCLKEYDCSLIKENM